MFSVIVGRVIDVCFFVFVGLVFFLLLCEINVENFGVSKLIFMCLICGLIFFFKSSMKRYMVNYLKVRFFRCEVCFKVFKWKDYLK